MNQNWQKAKKVFVGGVNSPVRAFKAVGGEPVFMRSGSGAYLTDDSKKRYIDYCLSWGALLLGHAFAPTVAAIKEQAEKGTSFGTATEYEITLAEEIQKAFPDMQKIRFTSSGTEAAMSAIRLARGVTKKDRIIKFEGCYHGHADSLLVKAGSGLATFGKPDSEGVVADLARWTTTLPYNDVAALKSIEKLGDIACIIVEPVAGNMGVVPAKKEFLQALRKSADKTNSFLIMDEVISGFRVTYGGAQHLYGVKPDLTILGKIIGGGLPVGAFGGSEKIMNHLAPLGGVYQAGTLSGNPLSMAAGVSVLSKLNKDLYRELDKKTEYLVREAGKIFKKKDEDVVIQRAGSMFTFFFSKKEIQNFEDAKHCDLGRFKRYFHHLLKLGIYTPPSQFESSFVSAAHSDADVEKTLKCINKC